jgi:hypothetical protein
MYNESRKVENVLKPTTTRHKTGSPISPGYVIFIRFKVSITQQQCVNVVTMKRATLVVNIL